MAGTQGYRALPQALDSPSATFVVDSLTGGMNTKIHPTRLSENEASLIQNMRIKQGAFAEKRPGISDITSAGLQTYTQAGRVYGLGAHLPNAAVPSNRLLATIGQNVGGTPPVTGYYRWEGTPGTGWEVLELPSGATGSGPTGNRVRFVQVFDTMSAQKDQTYFLEEGNLDVFAFSGSRSLSKVNGEANGLKRSVPQGKDAAFWLSRLWIAGEGENDGYVYFSKPGNPSTFDTTEGYLINPNDQMQRIIPFMQNGIICFMRESIWLLDIDQANFGDLLFDSTAIMPLNSDVGTIAPESVVQAGHDFFFLSRFGVHRLSKTEQDRPLGVVHPISDNIQGTISRINWDYAENAVGVVWENLYMLAVPLDSATSNNTVLVYDMLEKAWSIFTGWNVNDFQLARFSGMESLYFGDTANGKVYEVFPSATNADNVTPIESIVETPRFSFGGTHYRKHFQFLDLFCMGATGGTVELWVAPDEASLVQHDQMTITDGAVTLPDPAVGGLTLPFTLTEGGLNRHRFYLDSFGAVREMQFKFRVYGTNRTKILYYSVNAIPEQENLE